MKEERVRIAVFGQERWGTRLVQAVQRYGPPGGPEIFYEPAESLLCPQLAGEVRTAQILLRVGFRPGARTARGRLFDLAWSRLRRADPRAAAACYWIGTDVLNATAEWKAGRLDERTMQVINAFRNVAVSRNLVEELKAMGITAALAPFPDSLPVPPDPCVFPQRFTVLMYIPDARPAFYGSAVLTAAAQAMPETEFLVAGGTGAWWKDHPANVQFLGWRSDMASVFGRCTVYLRIVQHDGLPRTVVEALACGRQVVYNWPFPYCGCVRSGDAAEVLARLRQLRQASLSGKLPVNTGGQAYVARTCEPHVLTGDLLRSIGAV